MTEGALLICIVAVVARSRSDLAGHLVTHETVFFLQQIVRNLWYQVDQECSRVDPSLGCVAGGTRPGQVVLRWLVAVAAGILWNLLALKVTASAGDTLVGTLQRDRVIRDLCLSEADWCVALLAAGSIVVIFVWLVTIGALGFLGQVQALVAIQALRIGVFAHQFHWMRIGFHLGPHFCRLVTGVTFHGRHRFVFGNVAGVAIGQFAVELTGLVAIQTHSHRADDVPTDGVKPVTNTTMAVAAPNAGQLAVCDFIVWSPESILGKLLR